MACRVLIVGDNGDSGDAGRLRGRRGVSEIPGVHFLFVDDWAFSAGQIDANRELSTGKSTGPTPHTAGIREGAF